jgi:predicted nucleic acid-binding protein
MIAYVDSSIFLKLIFIEDGTPAAEEIWDGNTNLVSSRIMRVETRAALARGGRDGRLERKLIGQTMKIYEELWSRIAVIEITPRLAELACEVSESTQLRSLDSIHMASALVVGADILASADSEMCIAARNFGLSVANPLERA